MPGEQPGSIENGDAPCGNGINVGNMGAGSIIGVRIGIGGNNEANCGSDDSFIGFGGQVNQNTNGCNLATPGISVGDISGGTCNPQGPGAADIEFADFGYILVK